MRHVDEHAQRPGWLAMAVHDDVDPALDPTDRPVVANDPKYTIAGNTAPDGRPQIFVESPIVRMHHIDQLGKREWRRRLDRQYAEYANRWTVDTAFYITGPQPDIIMLFHQLQEMDG